MRMPTRKIRPAAQTQASVVSITNPTPRTGCHDGTPGGTDWRKIMSIGVEKGKNERLYATVLLGSCKTLPMRNIGSMARSMTGHNRFCVSFISVQAAPMAMNSEPYIKAAKD